MAACGVWWFIWPAHVAERVTTLLNAGNFEEISPLLATESDRAFLDYLEYMTRDARPPREATFSATPRERTWSEVLCGRQQFILGFHLECLVERGSVSFPGSEDFLGALERQKEFDQLEKEFYERHPEEVDSRPDSEYATAVE